ncbi:MAG: hypothetical protein KCHDKBKB_02995 [Elusimicrobia bacterium]|nr:hypothetical protein [Elusimicrobiota bacterium]
MAKNDASTENTTTDIPKCKHVEVQVLHDKIGAIRNDVNAYLMKLFSENPPCQGEKRNQLKNAFSQSDAYLERLQRLLRNERIRNHA